ncbi:MAG: hypothetical protein EA427_17560 [Spirochaetaceae bacterium]|nr:MAG: hypothetical protein EA427_17560 [Spirochaetaceae bacterium]
MMVIAFTRRATFAAAVRFVRSVATCFFLPQYETVLRPALRPLVCVDDPLDRRIPFRPEYVQTYLGFVHLWIKSCHFLFRTFGAASLPAIRDFVEGITSLYHSASRVYDKCQSTTTRPPCSGNLQLRFIRTVDPHVHCVPSLHVMIVVYTWLRMEAIIENLRMHAAPSLSRRDFSAEVEYLRREALAITESVLYIKQHSVNCVPAALFALHDLLEGFTVEAGDRFVDGLFESDFPDGESRGEIRTHMKRLHRHFLAEKAAGRVSREVILHFLRSRGVLLSPARPDGLDRPEPSRLPVT